MDKGKTHRMHIRDTYRQAKKHIDRKESYFFPSVLSENVDSDHWVDFHSFDALEEKMNEITNGQSDNAFKQNDKSIGKNVEDVQALISLLEYFVDGKSDIRGIATDTAESGERDGVYVDSTSFVNVLHTTLKSEEKGFTSGNIVDAPGQIVEGFDLELLRLFSKHDLDLDGHLSVDGEGEGVREIMVRLTPIF